MPVTKDYHRVGKTTAYGQIGYQVPLADPTTDGNLGLQGWDDEVESRRCPNLGLARAWCKRRAVELTKLHPTWRIDWVSVTPETWVADEYDDSTYGRILDAVVEVGEQQYGNLTDDGEIEWDED